MPHIENIESLNGLREQFIRAEKISLTGKIYHKIRLYYTEPIETYCGLSLKNRKVNSVSNMLEVCTRCAIAIGVEYWERHSIGFLNKEEYWMHRFHEPFYSPEKDIYFYFIGDIDSCEECKKHTMCWPYIRTNEKEKTLCRDCIKDPSFFPNLW